jgi:hypothetical protein
LDALAHVGDRNIDSIELVNIDSVGRDDGGDHNVPLVLMVMMPMVMGTLCHDCTRSSEHNGRSDLHVKIVTQEFLSRKQWFDVLLYLKARTRPIKGLLVIVFAGTPMLYIVVSRMNTQLVPDNMRQWMQKHSFSWRRSAEDHALPASEPFAELRRIDTYRIAKSKPVARTVSWKVAQSLTAHSIAVGLAAVCDSSKESRRREDQESVVVWERRTVGEHKGMEGANDGKRLMMLRIERCW